MEFPALVQDLASTLGIRPASEHRLVTSKNDISFSGIQSLDLDYISDGMEHWPGHERIEESQTLKDKGKHSRVSSFWRWPHLDHGSIGRVTLVSEGGRVKWSTVLDTSNDARWLPLGRPTKVFPETRSTQVNQLDHSHTRRVEKGIQYLRTYFPDADFPGDLIKDTLEADAREMRSLNAFDPFLGNMLEIIPCHHTQGESTVVFPMGELGSELNISRCTSDKSGNMVFQPTGSPSFVFETPIVQISSAVGPSDWIATPFSSILIRTHTSSSLVHLKHSRITRELNITRSETGDVPIIDSRILASGPDIIVVNRSGEVYKCNTHHGGKAMQLVGAHEDKTDDHFWQLGVTGRDDECFLASCRTVKHLDLRSAGPVADVFSIDHPSAVVTFFESPMHDYTSRVTTTSDVIWLDDRFRRRPLLSIKHHRGFDRTLRVLTANFAGASFSLLSSRRNSLVTLYDVSRGSDRLLHCKSVPSCLPHNESMFTRYDGHALVALPSKVELAFFSLCQRGSIHQQDIRVTGLDPDQHPSTQETHVTHEWDKDVQALERRVNQLKIDFGPVAERHHTKVNLRGLYEKMFAMSDDAQDNMDRNTLEGKLARLPDAWMEDEEIADNMLTTHDIISSTGVGKDDTSRADFNINTNQVFDALMRGQIPSQKLASLAPWHYNIQDTSIPALNYCSADCNALNEHLKELDLVSGAEGNEPYVQRETEAREQLVLDLALSSDVYSARPLAAGETTNTMPRAMGKSYSQKPPEVKFGYFRPIRKSGANHYGDKNEDGEHGPGVSSPLGVRLLLAEWELGTDPGDYAYQDPYDPAEMDEQPLPQYRKSFAASPMPPKKQMASQRPPAVVAAALQPPAVHALERTPPGVQSQTVRRAQSQQPESRLDTSSQEPVMSTQVLPGPFGGRPSAGKKPVKKRIGGF